MLRVFVAVDVSNLYYCVKKRFKGGKLDYKKFLELCSKNGQVYRAIAYASTMTGSDAPNKFFDCIQNFGFTVKTKVVKTFEDDQPGGENKKLKADWDLGMAIDVIRHINRIDTVILGTADGDMASLVHYLHEHGIRVHVIACGISSDLKACVDSYIEIGPSLLETEDAGSQTNGATEAAH
jgi:uncharacterized LabA/DUF88 family protein